MAQRHGDRLRRGCRAGPQEKLDQRDLQTLFARRRARHDQLQRIVQIGLVDAARDHGLGDLDDVVGHPFHQRRVVGDEPEELGIAEILRAVRLAIARGLDDAFAQQAWLGVEKARQPRYIAAPDRRHGSAKRTIADHRAIEQLDDGGLVGGLALFRRGERRPALAVTLPFQRAVADQQLDEGKRAARRGSVQRRSAGTVVADFGTGRHKRLGDRDSRIGRRVARTSQPQRRVAVAANAFGRMSLAQKTLNRRQVAGMRRGGERRQRHRRIVPTSPVDSAHQIGPAGQAVGRGDFPLRLGEAQRLPVGQAFGLLAQMFLGGASGKLAARAVSGGHDSPFP